MVKRKGIKKYRLKDIVFETEEIFELPEGIIPLRFNPIDVLGTWKWHLYYLEVVEI